MSQAKDLIPLKIEPNNGSDISNEKDFENEDLFVPSPKQTNTVMAWIELFDEQYSQGALAEEEGNKVH